METGSALVCCVAALLIGFYVGRRWAPGPAVAVLIGLGLGGFCVAVFLSVTSALGARWPQLLDAHVLGLHLIIVMMAAPVCGALGSLLGFRRSRGLSLF